jgi:enoyl-CoA hydratase/carnithine racemase
MSGILSLPIPTVAALNGHTAAAGAALALSCDLRVMNSESGVFFLPAVDIGLRYSPGFVELVKLRAKGGSVVRDVLLQSKKFDAGSALDAGLVDLAVPSSKVLQSSIDLALNYRKIYKEAVGAVKAEAYKSAISALEDTTPEKRDMGWYLFCSEFQESQSEVFNDPKGPPSKL